MEFGLLILHMQMYFNSLVTNKLLQRSPSFNLIWRNGGHTSHNDWFLSIMELSYSSFGLLILLGKNIFALFCTLCIYVRISQAIPYVHACTRNPYGYWNSHTHMEQPYTYRQVSLHEQVMSSEKFFLTCLL